jgi:metal-responsive CopG/Arc/MetJ family transcriptional regulator
MKTKTSVTLDGGLLRGIDQHAADYRSRSEFIEAAVEYFIRHLERQEAEQRDLDILIHGYTHRFGVSARGRTVTFGASE